MRTRIETGLALYEQHVGFAWWPVKAQSAYVWLQSYWLVVKHCGQGFVSEYRFATETEADIFFDRLSFGGAKGSGDHDARTSRRAIR